MTRLEALMQPGAIIQAVGVLGLIVLMVYAIRRKDTKP